MKTYFILKWFQKKELGSKTKHRTLHLLKCNSDAVPTSWPGTTLHKPSANLKAVPTS